MDSILRSAGLGISLVMIWTFATPSLALANGSKPTRSKCIVGFGLDWSGVESDPVEVTNALWWTPGKLFIEPAPAMKVDSDGKHLYLQFKQDCGNKEELSEELISYWKSQNRDLPEFIGLEGPIEPSPGTIDYRGPYWRD